MLLGVAQAGAHQPRIAYDTDSSESNPIIVKDPEVSKAYYGNLRGKPDYYQISSDASLTLYLNILIPEIKGYEKKDFFVQVTDQDNNQVLLINGSEYEWNPFYEPYGGDNYIMGPDARAAVSEGTYRIKVYSPENQGRYSLAIGEIESFPPAEMINALIVIPQIKQHFFGKTLIESYSNTSGLTILGIAALLLMTIALVLRRRAGKNRKN